MGKIKNYHHTTIEEGMRKKTSSLSELQENYNRKVVPREIEHCGTVKYRGTVWYFDNMNELLVNAQDYDEKIPFALVPETEFIGFRKQLNI